MCLNEFFAAVNYQTNGTADTGAQKRGNQKRDV